MKHILSILILLIITTAQAQNTEQSFTYRLVYVEDNGKVLRNWEQETNTFIFNVNGTTNLTWTSPQGSITFSPISDKKTGYSPNGEFYELIEMYDNEMYEEIWVQRWPNTGTLRLIFSDNYIMEFQQ